jgi:hypothetical protein
MTNPNPNPNLVSQVRAVAEPARVELRVPIDATEAPNVFEDDYPDGTDLAVELAGPGLLATLVVPVEWAREWAGELFAAVSVAYRELTGDPHALSDDELAALPPADEYNPGAGVMLTGDESSPARVRFHVLVDIEAEFLSTGGLRAAIVDALTERFNTTTVAVSAGEPLAGRPL